MDRRDAREAGLSFRATIHVRNHHLSAAIGKTGASTHAEAARIAEEHGWL